MANKTEPDPRPPVTGPVPKGGPAVPPGVPTFPTNAKAPAGSQANPSPNKASLGR